MTDTSENKTEGARLRTSDRAAASDAGRALGSVRTERKAESSRANILKAKAEGKVGGRPQKPLSEIPCTCGGGLALEGHPTTCARGLAIRRRQKAGTL